VKDHLLNQTTNYDCLGFNDDLPKGKASGTMSIDTTAILFQIQEHHIRMPLLGAEISLGGASNRLVFFEHPAFKGWSFYTSDHAILNDVHLRNQPTIAATLTHAKHKKISAWGLLGLVVALIIAGPSLMILRMDIITKVIAKQIPPAWEEQLAESTIAQYQLGKDVMDKHQTETLLNPLVEPLIAALDHSVYRYHFHIVNDGSMNAFALPGGEVVIHSALLLRADSAEELLGVLAHEITHVEQQHGLRNVIGATGIYVIAGAILGDVNGVLAAVSGAAPMLLNQSYSRRFEAESDVKGFALLQKANINPSGLASFLVKMIEEEKMQMEKIEDEKTRNLIKGALKFLSTHPASEARIEKLHQLNHENSTQIEYKNLAPHFATLQTAVKQFVTDNKNKGENIHEE